MVFRKFKTTGVAHVAYMVADHDEAVVVDPRRDVEEYLEVAQANQLTIKYVLEMHRQEDFVIGSRRLRERLRELGSSLASTNSSGIATCVCEMANACNSAVWCCGRCTLLVTRRRACVMRFSSPSRPTKRWAFSRVIRCSSARRGAPTSATARGRPRTPDCSSMRCMEGWRLWVTKPSSGPPMAPVRYSQGNRSKSGELGLYIARRIVDAHGGRICAESTVGQGSMFFVSLPS